ncbi:MAG: RNA polymerase sigma factor [Ruminococcus sp.]|nr:RNA polymerase sigma factor [Ruminococcus sp.]
MDNGAECYRKFLEGDNDSLTLIIRDYKDGLMLYLYRFTNDIFTAEDLTEDTFVKLYTKRPKFLSKSSFKTWLYAIGRNLALDHRRKHPFSKVSMDECQHIRDITDIEAAYEKTEQAVLLGKAMYNIKSDYRQVLHLVYIEEFSIEESGKIMGKSNKQIGNLLYRAKKSLRSELEKEGIYCEKL